MYYHLDPTPQLRQILDPSRIQDAGTPWPAAEERWGY